MIAGIMSLVEGRHVLFNNALIAFLYSYINTGHMVKDHIYSEAESPLPPLYG